MNTTPTDQFENTDRELWREKPGDYYSPSIHVTAQGAIGINVGGTVYVRNVRDWHAVMAFDSVKAVPPMPREQAAAIAAKITGKPTPPDQTPEEIAAAIANCKVVGKCPTCATFIRDYGDRRAREATEAERERAKQEGIAALRKHWPLPRGNSEGI